MPGREFADKYLDVFQNIESVVAKHYHEHPDLSDHKVERMYELLIREYKAQATGHTPPKVNIPDDDNDLVLLVGLRSMCEWRLGHMSEIGGPKVEPKTVEEIIECLKHLRKSVQFWTKQSGRQGYLNYIIEFF
jgi:hypothetical protein